MDQASYSIKGAIDAAMQVINEQILKDGTDCWPEFDQFLDTCNDTIWTHFQLSESFLDPATATYPSFTEQVYQAASIRFEKMKGRVISAPVRASGYLDAMSSVVARELYDLVDNAKEPLMLSA